MSEMETLPVELEQLFAMERPVPAATEETRARVWHRLEGTIGAIGGGGGGGGGGTGGSGGAGGAWKAAVLGAALMVGVAGVVGVYIAGRDDGVGGRKVADRPGAPPGATRDPASLGGRPATGREGASTVDAPMPEWESQSGLTPRAIAGVVVYEGRPVAGADVELGGLSSSAALRGPEARIRTDADGRFRFTPKMAATYFVSASSPGSAGATVRADGRDPEASPPVDQLVLNLGDCTASVRGRVTDAAGNPIAGARVRHAGHRTSTDFGPAVRAGADASYELCVRAGNVRLRVDAAGYGSQMAALVVHGRHRVDVTLVPEGFVIGSVVVAETGAPVPRAQVNLWPRESGPAMVSGVSDDAGRFQLDGIAPGRYSMNVWARDALTARSAHEVVVEAGAASDVGVVRLDAATMVSGVVVDSKGSPVAGATVGFAHQTLGAISFAAISQQDGSFSVRGAMPGTTKPWVEGYQVVVPERVTVTTDAMEGVRIQVRSKASVSGRVLYRGRPAADVEVQAFGGPADRGGAPIAATSGADGSYTLRGLGAGKWLLFGNSVELGGFSTAQLAVTVTDGERVTDVDVVLDGGASIAGVVVDQNGAPVTGAEVRFQLQGGDDRGDSLTAEDGSFRVRQLSGGGVYLAEVRPYMGAVGGMRAGAGGFPPVTVADGSAEITGIRLVVERAPRTISGHVVDEAGRPIPDARVRAALADSGTVPLFAPSVAYPSAVSDEKGAFSLTVWDEGNYALVARLGNGTPAVIAGVRAGTKNVRLRLVRPGSITGELRGFSDAVVVARDAQSTTAAAHAAQVTGNRFAFGALSPGTYLVTVTGQGIVGAAEAVVRAGEATQVVVEARPQARLRGRVEIHGEGGAAPGFMCQVGPRMGDAQPPFGYLSSDGLRGVTGPEGSFVIESAPAGDVWVWCSKVDPGFSDGLAAATVTAGGADVEVVVKVVRDRDRGGARPGSVGFRFDQAATRPVVWAVKPESAAAQAGVPVGGLVVAVDGQPVDGLSPRGVEILVGGRPQGERARVTIVAPVSGKSTNYELVVGPPWDWW